MQVKANGTSRALLLQHLVNTTATGRLTLPNGSQLTIVDGEPVALDGRGLCQEDRVRVRRALGFPEIPEGALELALANLENSSAFADIC